MDMRHACDCSPGMIVRNGLRVGMVVFDPTSTGQEVIQAMNINSKHLFNIPACSLVEIISYQTDFKY